jgi:hypothetical protein
VTANCRVGPSVLNKQWCRCRLTARIGFQVVSRKRARAKIGLLTAGGRICPAGPVKAEQGAPGSARGRDRMDGPARFFLVPQGCAANPPNDMHSLQNLIRHRA